MQPKAASKIDDEAKRSGLARLQVAALSQTPVSLGTRRTASPHEFYRYPARFSPEFAGAAIEAFTAPGELVLDPFVGGGTTLVEAMLLGRRSFGSDINSLATFVSRVKTTPLNEVDIALLRRWAGRLPRVLDLHKGSPSLDSWAEAGYLKDLDESSTWRIKKLIALAIASSDRLPQQVQRDFARCVVLRTGQWALDMRSEVPSVALFKDTLIEQGRSMIAAARDFADSVGERTWIRPAILTQALPGLADRPIMKRLEPRLILTSPPYPGVYVNYHRWKLRGRSEIPAPYWIANRFDGNGMAHYTMGARSDRSGDIYFERIEAAYRDLRRIATKKTTVVQLVGFNDVDRQLERFLDAMYRAGFREMLLPELANDADGRLWRSVPGRRWWTSATSMKEIAPHTAWEALLVHHAR